MRYLPLFSLIVLSLFVLGCAGEKAGEATFYTDNSYDGGRDVQVVGANRPDIREGDTTIAAPQVSIGGKEVVAVQETESFGGDGAESSDDVSADNSGMVGDASDIPGRPDGSGDSGSESNS